MMGRRRRSRCFWEPVWIKFQSRGQSQADFAREHGLHPKTLSRWISKFREESVAEAEGSRFVPVVVGQPQDGKSTPVLLELMLPNGIGMRLEVDKLDRVLELASGLGKL